MSQLSYSFCQTLLHSLWQAVALLLLFTLLNRSIIQKNNPGQKRNLLFLLIAVQLLFSVITFYISYCDQENGFTFFNTASSYILQNDILQWMAPWIFLAYLVALFYKTVLVIYRWKSFQSQYRRGLQKPSADLKMFTTLHSNYFGIKRKVTLWLSNAVTAPVTFGYFKPVILLPVALINNLTLHQAETLILHELTHIKANDYLLNWFLLLTETIFFFNPFILALCKKIKLEREKSCDISVLNFKYNPVTYAEALLLAERQKQLLIPAFQLAAVSTKQQLLGRIKYFSNPANYNNKKRNGLWVSLLSSVFILCVGIFTFIHFEKITVTDTGTERVTTRSFIADVANEVNDPVLINNLVTSSSNIFKSVVEKTIEEVIRQKPFIEKQVRNIAPLIKSLGANLPELNETAEPTYATPASIQDNDGTRQVIVKEEQSGSKNASVKVYTLTYNNGHWIMIPEWRAAAKERLHDSSQKFDNAEL